LSLSWGKVVIIDLALRIPAVIKISSAVASPRKKGSSSV